MGIKSNFKTGKALIQKHIWGKKTPIRISFNTTLKCNFRCAYCGIMDRKSKELSTLEAIGIIDEFAALGGASFSFFGGEPLMREDIGELVNRAKSHGLFVSMTTNAWFLPERYEMVKGVDLFSISFDGPREVHDSSTHPGSYDRCVESFKLLREKGKKFWVLNVLSAKNLDHIDFILDMADEYGFYVGFGIVQDHSIAGGILPPGFVAPDREYKRAVKKLIAAKKNGRRIYSSMTYLKQLYNWRDYAKMFPEENEIIPEKERGKGENRLRQPGNTPCYAGDLYAYLDVDGKLYPCLYQGDRMEGQDVLELGLKEAFNRLKRPPYCLCSPLSVATCELNLVFDLKPLPLYNSLSILRP